MLHFAAFCNFVENLIYCILLHNSHLLIKQAFTPKGIPTEKELRVILLKLIAAFFLLGLAIEIVVFPRVEHWPLFCVYIASDLLLLLAYLLFRRGLIDDNRALVMQALAISAAQCTDMVMQIAAPGPDTGIVLMASACIMIVPVIAAGMTTWKPLPFLLAGICMLIYGIGAFVSGNEALANMFVSLTFLLAGIAVLQRILMNAWRHADYTRERVAEQNAVISRFFNVTPKELELITKGKMTRQKATELLERSERKVSTALIDRVKDVIVKEETVKQAIRKTHSGLTDKDLQLCCHIAEGLTAGEIAHITSKALSSVTARRSRLRTKLGLKEGESLRDHIMMLVNREVV